MYIRRKVFSLLQDETGEERYFSTTDITLEDAEQRIFSLNEYDDEYEQREYADKEDSDSNTAAKIAAAAAGAATLAGSTYAAKKGAFGGKAQKAVSKAIMDAGWVTGSKKLFKSGAKDYARGSVKVADKIKGRIKNMDEVGRKIYNKRVVEERKKLMDAFDVKSASKKVKKIKNAGKSKPGQLLLESK